jgi:hypothetical protein
MSQGASCTPQDKPEDDFAPRILNNLNNSKLLHPHIYIHPPSRRAIRRLNYFIQ